MLPARIESIDIPVAALPLATNGLMPPWVAFSAPPMEMLLATIEPAEASPFATIVCAVSELEACRLPSDAI